MSNYTFNVEQVTRDCIEWIQEWFNKNGKNCSAFLGLSGGKDSTVCAALLAKALGPARVFGISMPTTGQGINEADEIANFLGINYLNVPIGDICNQFHSSVHNTEYAQLNLPPRVRMTMLYFISQSNNGRVCETSNLSENVCKYYTLFGDNAGDMSPLGKLTVTEVKQIGKYLGIPDKWIDKTPDDGLPHSKPDEEKLGVTYHDVDIWIRTGFATEEVKQKIDEIISRSSFKEGIVNIPTFNPNINI